VRLLFFHDWPSNVRERQLEVSELLRAMKLMIIGGVDARTE
jgi:hypothetical protein